MSIECMVFIVGVVVQLASEHSWVQFAIGRLVSGLGVGALSAVVPLYQAETAPPQIRGTLTATYQLFITLGILVANCISIGARQIPASGSWRTVVGVGILWPLILGIGIQLMPESPRWLATRDRIPEAHRAIGRSRGMDVAEAESHHGIRREVEEMRLNAEHERKMQAGWLQCFKVENKTLYRTLLGISLQSLQQLTGANYFFYYGATVFKSVGISDSFVTQIILGAVNFFSTFGGLYVMEKYGRRFPLIIGGVWQSVWLFVFAAAGTAKDPTTNPAIGKLMIVAACMFIFGFAMTWAPGIWILIGETFPTRTRAKQGAMATASNWLWNFLLAFFTPFIVSAIGFRFGFIFAACNLVGAVVVYLFLYESSDLSLESVDKMYCDPACKPWNSKKWAPEGYESRGHLAAEEKKAEEGHVGASGGTEERFEDTGSHHGSDVGIVGGEDGSKRPANARLRSYGRT